MLFLSHVVLKWYCTILFTMVFLLHSLVFLWSSANDEQDSRSALQDIRLQVTLILVAFTCVRAQCCWFNVTRIDRSVLLTTQVVHLGLIYLFQNVMLLPYCEGWIWRLNIIQYMTLFYEWFTCVGKLFRTWYTLSVGVCISVTGVGVVGGAGVHSPQERAQVAHRYLLDEGSAVLPEIPPLKYLHRGETDVLENVNSVLHYASFCLHNSCIMIIIWLFFTDRVRAGYKKQMHRIHRYLVWYTTPKVYKLLQRKPKVFRGN